MQGTLDRYGTAEQRIRAFYQRFPEGSIQTDLVRLEPGLLIFRARAFRDRTDPVPTTGWAYDRPGSDADGAATARILAACEAAAIGRALANLGLAGPLRPCREEMEKVARLRAADRASRSGGGSRGGQVHGPRRDAADRRAGEAAGRPDPADRIRALLSSLRLPAERRRRIEARLEKGMTDREAHEIEAYLLALRSQAASRRAGVDAALGRR
ncbi:MAG TPA: hypothetical protein VF192_04180 [Longimicrobiales bacterium]|jgi:hypothetical protein